MEPQEEGKSTGLKGSEVATVTLYKEVANKGLLPVLRVGIWIPLCASGSGGLLSSKLI